MEHYVTIFDSLFLPQGLALSFSLMRHAGEHMLWILCVDDGTYDVISRLNLRGITPLRLTALETDELRAARKERTHGEYCWTLTPFAPRFVFDADQTVKRVTYLDADVWLVRSPVEIWDDLEFSGKGVLITEHAYAADVDQTASAGRYCVQWMTFDRSNGEAARSWWAERCLEWCYARHEEGRFGDQKYLDDWPTRFRGKVHVLSNRALTQAPWNCERFAAGEAVIFHFHGLRLLQKDHVLLSRDYRIPLPTLDQIYKPYLSDLRSALSMLAHIGFQAHPQSNESIPLLKLRMFLQPLRNLWQRLWVKRLITF